MSNDSKRVYTADGKNIPAPPKPPHSTPLGKKVSPPPKPQTTQVKK